MNYHVVFANRRSQICIDLLYTAKGNEKGHPKCWGWKQPVHRWPWQVNDRGRAEKRVRMAGRAISMVFAEDFARFCQENYLENWFYPMTIGIWSTLGYQESTDCVFCRVSGASVSDVMCPYFTVQKPVGWWFENSIQFYSISWGLSMHWEFRS